jgi:hypothetical protein
MPKQKAPNSGTFLPASLMYFLSGKLMQLRSGVDNDVDYRTLSKHAKLIVDTRNAYARAGVTSDNVVKS